MNKAIVEQFTKTRYHDEKKEVILVVRDGNYHGEIKLTNICHDDLVLLKFCRKTASLVDENICKVMNSIAASKSGVDVNGYDFTWKDVKHIFE